MNPCQTKLYEAILARLEARGVSLGAVLAKHAPENKRNWLLENDGVQVRPIIHYAARLTPMELLASFVQKIEATEDQSKCWEFSGYCNPYGQTYVLRKIIRCHVLMQSLFTGLPESYGGKSVGYNAVRHTCDNPKCCNPHHLLNGTVKDNIEDVFVRGKKIHDPKYGKTITCPVCLSPFLFNRNKQGEYFCSRKCYDSDRTAHLKTDTNT